MKYLKYIKNFSKISVSKLCRKKKINRGNLLNDKTTEKNELKIKNEIENEFIDLYKEDIEESLVFIIKLLNKIKKEIKK